VLLDEIREPRRRVGTSEAASGRTHPIEAVGLGEQLRHHRIETRWIAIRVEHDDRGAGLLEVRALRT
jgi:hypothetical protein